MIEPLFLLMRWIQTIPLLPLMTMPFEAKDLRLSRGRVCLLSVGYMLLVSAVMAVISKAVSIDGQRNIIVRDLGMLVMMVIYFWGWASVIRTSAVRKTLAALVMLHYAAILNALSNIAAALILGDGYVAAINADAGSLTFDLCLLAITAVTWPLMWHFLKYVLAENLPTLDDRQTWHGVSYMCIIFLMFCVVTYNPPYERQMEILIMVVGMAVTDMTAYYIFFQEIGAVRRQEAALRQLESYRMQYQQISARVEEARRLRHDMHHHLITLGALNAQGKQAQIREYLGKYSAVYDRLEGYRLWDDPVMESVLGYYLIQAREEGIPVKCNVALKGVTGIDPMDMTVLLSNCLENSMEALRRLPAKKRMLDIDIQVWGGGNKLLLQIANPCADQEDTGGFTTWECFPSSKRRGERGVGLQSIAGSAEKYGGSAHFQRKDGVFTVRVILDLPQTNGWG